MARRSRRRRPRSVAAQFRQQLGELIKSARAAAGLTRAAIAAQADIHVETIRHIEEGRNFQVETLERIVNALQLDFLHLISRAAGLKMRAQLTGEQRRLLDAFRSAPEKHQEIVRLLLDVPKPAEEEPVEVDQDPLPFDEGGPEDV